MNMQSGISIQCTNVVIPVMDALDGLFSWFTCFLLYHLMPNKMVVLNSAACAIFLKEGAK